MSVHRANKLEDPTHATGNSEWNREKRVISDIRDIGDMGAEEKRRSKQEEEKKRAEKCKASVTFGVCSPFAPEVQAAIKQTAPRYFQSHWWKCVFALARELQGIPSLAGADPFQLAPIVIEWHCQASAYLPGHVCVEDVVIEFTRSWPAVKSPGGTSNFDRAVARMREAEDMPEVPEPYSSPTTRQLLCLCRELQRIAGDDPFHLSGEKAGQVVDCPSTTAWRRLKLLEYLGLIRCIERGKQGGQATRWRYIESTN